MRYLGLAVACVREAGVGKHGKFQPVKWDWSDWYRYVLLERAVTQIPSEGNLKTVVWELLYRASSVLCWSIHQILPRSEIEALSEVGNCLVEFVSDSAT